MAQMIPSVISPHVRSNAERRVFDWFRNSKGTENWIVLHSLGIATHNKTIYGEIDFLVLAPGKGMFAIEVKGGRVGRKDGVWYFTDRYGNVGTKRRGPFEQAVDAAYSVMEAIRSRLSKEYSYLNGLLFGTGVIFPDIEYHVEGIDHEQWQVHDLRNGNDVTGFISHLSRNTAEKIKAKFGREITFQSFLGVKEVRYLAGILRGDFDRPIPLQAHIRSTEEQRIILTEEQYRLVDQLEDNPRCLIQGGAGTGKTLIAVQEAAKSVANGKKTALICFNKNLGQWLDENFPDPSVRPDFIGTFHSLMLDLLKQSGSIPRIPPHEAEKRRYFEEILPQLVLDSLQNKPGQYELLVLDEAQDLVNESYLEVFDAILAGGFTRGRWRMFGDFSMQAIFSHSMKAEDMFALLEQKSSYINFKLTVNCRNPKPVCDEIKMVTGFSPIHETAYRIGGPPVSYYTYKDEEDGAKTLQVELGRLISEGVEPAQITLLSLRKRENSMVRLVKIPVIEDYSSSGNERISFSTIQGFKGLENQVIMITDVISFRNDQLLYVAYSRTVTALYVFISENAGKEYRELQIRGFRE